MSYDGDALDLQREARLRQQHHAAIGRTACEQTTPEIEMHIGPWYVDEFGNKTREIKARE
jgi:hypothetical protein